MNGMDRGAETDLNAVYIYTSKNEIASPRFTQRADFITYICFVCAVILVSCSSF